MTKFKPLASNTKLLDCTNAQLHVLPCYLPQTIVSSFVITHCFPKWTCFLRFQSLCISSLCSLTQMHLVNVTRPSKLPPQLSITFLLFFSHRNLSGLLLVPSSSLFYSYSTVVCTHWVSNMFTLFKVGVYIFHFLISKFLAGTQHIMGIVTNI